MFSARAQLPAIRAVSESPEEAACRALVFGIRDYSHKCGFQDIVLGLSGGIDSASTACLAAAALGPDRVTGVAMPTRSSSRGSLDDAEALARNLGIRYEVVSIDAIYQSYLDGLAGAAFGQNRTARPLPGASGGPAASTCQTMP